MSNNDELLTSSRELQACEKCHITQFNSYEKRYH